MSRPTSSSCSETLNPHAPCSSLASTKVTRNAKAAATELGIEFTIEKIKNIDEIIVFGVMATPGLVVDGEVKSVGKVPDAEEIKTLLA